MADLSKLQIALCQMEVVEGQPSCYERALKALLARVRSTGAHLAVVSPSSFGGTRPRLVALNGAVLLEEERQAQVAVGSDLYRIGIDVPGDSLDGDAFDFVVSSRTESWTVRAQADGCAAWCLQGADRTWLRLYRRKGLDVGYI